MWSCGFPRVWKLKSHASSMLCTVTYVLYPVRESYGAFCFDCKTFTCISFTMISKSKELNRAEDSVPMSHGQSMI